MVRVSPWYFGGVAGRSAEERIEALARRMDDLEAFLSTVHRDLAFGPLDSQYLPVTLGADETAGTSVPDGTLDVRTFSFEADIVLIQYYCLGGNATVDITSNSTSLRTASLTGGTSVFYNEANDLPSPPRISGDLTFTKLSTDSGTPNRLRAWVILKRVSPVETT